MKSTSEYIDLLRTYYKDKAKEYGISRMALFGSVARGEQQSDSYVDVAYEGEANILLRSRMKIELEKIFAQKTKGEAPVPTKEEQLLSEIRDLLKEKENKQ